MDQETSDVVAGVLIFIILVPLIYLAARLAIRIAETWGAHILSPLSPAISGTIDKNGPCIRGTYQGYQLIVSFTPNHRVSGSDSFTREINAFYIEALDVKGGHDWYMKFSESDFLRQGPIRLSIQTQNEDLRQKLESSGVITSVASISTPTKGYVTVRYEALRQRLTYMEDVSPNKIPSQHNYLQQLALVAHLVKINLELNP